MRYENLQVDFWSDPDFDQESFELKALYVYYLTCPHGNLAGIYRVSDKSVLAETNIGSLKKLTRLKERLHALKKVLFDEDCNLVWVVGKGKRLKGKSQIEAARKILMEDIPECELKDKFLEKYTHLAGCGQGVETPRTGCPDPVKNKNQRVSGGSPTVTVSVTNNIPQGGPKEIQNQKIEKIQGLFEERFGEKLNIKQVQVLTHGGGNGKIYGFRGYYEALALAIDDIPQDVRDHTKYIFALANDGVTVEKYLKKVREKSEAEKIDWLLPYPI